MALWQGSWPTWSHYEGNDYLSRLFRIANDYAVPLGYKGFPNGNCAKRETNKSDGVLSELLAGAILIKDQSLLEFRDVLARDLGWPQGVSDRLAAVNSYAWSNGFAAAFPTFHQAGQGNDIVYGVIFIKSQGVGQPIEWRDVPAAELGNPADIVERFTRTYTYATQNGFVGGMPNGHRADYGSGLVYGTLLFRNSIAEWKDMVLATSFDPYPAPTPPPVPPAPTPPPEPVATALLSFRSPGYSGAFCSGTVNYSFRPINVSTKRGRNSAFASSRDFSGLATNISTTALPSYACVTSAIENELAVGEWEITVRGVPNKVTLHGGINEFRFG